MDDAAYAQYTVSGGSRKESSDDSVLGDCSTTKYLGLTSIGQYSHTQFIAQSELPTTAGTFSMRAYRSHGKDGTCEPVALVYGSVEGLENVKVRVHDQCITSEVFGSLKCDCHQQLEYAKKFIVEHSGIVIYMPQEGRGIGLANKVRAYALQETGVDTVDANRMLGFEDDYRTYEPVKAILGDLNVRSIELMTNNPRKMMEMSKLGVQVTKRIPIIMEAGDHNKGYLTAKAERMRHMYVLMYIYLYFAKCEIVFPHPMITSVK